MARMNVAPADRPRVQWEGLRQGLALGLSEPELRTLVAAKVGKVSAEVETALAALPVEALEDLASAIFGLDDEASLRGWLSGR
jgi:hypothetical protein